MQTYTLKIEISIDIIVIFSLPGSVEPKTIAGNRTTDEDTVTEVHNLLSLIRKDLLQIHISLTLQYCNLIQYWMYWILDENELGRNDGYYNTYDHLTFLF